MSDKLSPAIDVLIPHRCLLGEGPVWDARRHSLIWVDILRGEIHEYIPAEGKHLRLELGDMIGAFSLLPDGRFLAALQQGLALVSRDGETIEHVANPEAHLPENRFNDGKCDPQGRFWIGSMHLEEKPGAGNLYRVDADLEVVPQLSGVGVSNGLTWSADSQTFYYIDSPSRSVMAYDFDPASGSISHPRKIISVPEEDGCPDGMTIDKAGKLWIAHWDGAQVLRWDPETGEKLLKVELPVSRVTSCAFGGENYQDLYITSARVGLSEAQLAQEPLAGSTFVLRSCGFAGFPMADFAMA
ncbi:MAG: SMP-30/gluconolactonase/LRE family protein [Bacteroidota bacterium]